MNKLILTAVLTICMAGVAQADLFSFDGQGGADSTAIGLYMTGVYGHAITVSNATGYPYQHGSGSWDDPLPALSSSDHTDIYIADTTGSEHSFSISFAAMQITSVSFDWARASNAFYAEADGNVIFSSTGGQGGGSGSGSSGTLNFVNPVTTLTFHDSGSGAVGIDNLQVTPYQVTPYQVTPVVPVPAAVLLGLLGMGAAGLKLRRFA